VPHLLRCPLLSKRPLLLLLLLLLLLDVKAIRLQSRAWGLHISRQTCYAMSEVLLRVHMLYTSSLCAALQCTQKAVGVLGKCLDLKGWCLNS
jgi:hypothetical protein